MNTYIACLRRQRRLRRMRVGPYTWTIPRPALPWFDQYTLQRPNNSTRILSSEITGKLACSMLSVSEDNRKSERATSGISCERYPGGKRRGRETLPSPLLSLPDSVRSPTTFSIVHTDREPGTGYS